MDKFLLFGNRQVPILCAVDGTDFGQSAEKAASADVPRQRAAGNMRCNIENLEGEKCDATFPKG